MAGMYGADVAELREMASQFDRAAARLRSSSVKVNNTVQVSAWLGPVAVTFRANWESSYHPGLHNAVELLTANAEALRRNAAEQESASAANPGSPSTTTTEPPYPTPAEMTREWLDGLPRVKENWRDSLKNSNPHYGDFDQKLSTFFWSFGGLESSGEYRNNCGYAAIAYDMRRRGYDVTAAPDLNGDTESNLASTYVDPATGQPPEWRTTGNRSATVDAIKDLGPGSRAIVQVRWKGDGGGHAFVVENVDGKVVFLDPQSNKVDVDGYFDRIEPGSVKILRTDNLEPRMNPMSYYMVTTDE